MPNRTVSALSPNKQLQIHRLFDPNNQNIQKQLHLFRKSMNKTGYKQPQESQPGAPDYVDPVSEWDNMGKDGVTSAYARDRHAAS